MDSARFSLSGTALKRVALLSMLLDHIGASLLEAGLFARTAPAGALLRLTSACAGPGGWPFLSTAFCWWRAFCTPTACAATPGGCCSWPW